VSLAFWAWVTVAVVCALAESVTGGLFTLPWAIGAGTAAALEAFQVGVEWQWAAFFVISSVLFVVAQRFIVRRP
jgi:membrane protein implicated in regulation of membrane protease activity